MEVAIAALLLAAVISVVVMVQCVFLTRINLKEFKSCCTKHSANAKYSVFNDKVVLDSEEVNSSAVDVSAQSNL